MGDELGLATARPSAGEPLRAADHTKLLVDFIYHWLEWVWGGAGPPKGPSLCRAKALPGGELRL